MEEGILIHTPHECGSLQEMLLLFFAIDLTGDVQRIHKNFSAFYQYEW
jgi:hypothetical protein